MLPKFTKWWPRGPKVQQSEPKVAPKGHQRAPKTPQRSPRRPPEAPKRAQKRCPEHPERIFTISTSRISPFATPVERILGQNQHLRRLSSGFESKKTYFHENVSKCDACRADLGHQGGPGGPGGAQKSNPRRQKPHQPFTIFAESPPNPLYLKAYAFQPQLQSL